MGWETLVYSVHPVVQIAGQGPPLYNVHPLVQITDPPPLSISEVVPISQNRDSEYSLLPEKTNSVRKIHDKF